MHEAQHAITNGSTSDNSHDSASDMTNEGSMPQVDFKLGVKNCHSQRGNLKTKDHLKLKLSRRETIEDISKQAV